MSLKTIRKDWKEHEQKLDIAVGDIGRIVHTNKECDTIPPWRGLAIGEEERRKGGLLAANKAEITPADANSKIRITDHIFLLTERIRRRNIRVDCEKKMDHRVAIIRNKITFSCTVSSPHEPSAKTILSIRLGTTTAASRIQPAPQTGQFPTLDPGKGLIKGYFVGCDHGLKGGRICGVPEIVPLTAAGVVREAASFICDLEDRIG